MKKTILLRLAIVLAAVATFFLIAAPAMAIWDWCMFDPELKINDYTVDVKVMIENDHGSPNSLFNGNMILTVSVPPGTDTGVISCDKKIKVVFVENDTLSASGPGTQVDINLQIRAKGSVPLKMIVSQDGVPYPEIDASTVDPISYSLTVGP
jgi:hypothetical protein